MIPWLLSLMVSLVPPSNHKYGGENESDARERYETIATAISDISGDDVRLAKFLLTIARHESTFRKDVHSGENKGDQGRSWGLYQIMCGRKSTNEVPGTSGKYLARDIVGTDWKRTYQATDAAAIVLRPIIERCSGNARCVFMAYGGVSKTNIETDVRRRINARVRTYRGLGDRP